MWVVNDRVGDLSSEPEPKRQKVNEQHNYSPPKRASIGKYTIVHGPKDAMVHFQSILGHAITCRKFCDICKKEIQREVKESGVEESVITILELPKKCLGRPLLLGDVDAEVQKYVKDMRLHGGVINMAVVAAAYGLMLERHKGALVEHGGDIKLLTPKLLFKGGGETWKLILFT